MKLTKKRLRRLIPTHYPAESTVGSRPTICGIASTSSFSYYKAEVNCPKCLEAMKRKPRKKGSL